jgi:putative ATP-dependent endonuclease of the OLD family
MIIKRLKIENYRTLESLDVEFPGYYTAICGKNDAGKSNVIRAVRALFGEEDYFFRPGSNEISLKEDFTKWKAVGSAFRRISVSAIVTLDAERDAGLHQFITDYMKVTAAPKELTVELELTHASEDPRMSVRVKVAEQQVGGLKAEQVLNRFQSARAVLFHNSTDPDPRFGSGPALREFAGDAEQAFDAMKKTVNRSMNKIARKQQKELSELLGRLQERFRVGLSLPPFELTHIPVNITLGDRKIDIDLDAWGSGTRNRTLVLLALFRAKQLSEASASASKVTPVIIIEEPESFLHPSAQAEFGRVLQEMPAEFGVQVITTTHSPYMLSQKVPESNILLDRHQSYRQLRETVRVDTTGERWMEPFGLALGIANQEFAPWHELFFSKSECILLVEGETDRGYLELLRDPTHGSNALTFKGEIFPYGGKDALKNTVLLRFIKNRHKQMFVTFDLDAKDQVVGQLKPLGLEEGKHYCAVGIDAAGKRKIEGLLPDDIVNDVNAAHPNLVHALQGTTDERRSASCTLKKLYLDQFKKKAIPGKDHYKGLYAVAKTINKALNNAP